MELFFSPVGQICHWPSCISCRTQQNAAQNTAVTILLEKAPYDPCHSMKTTPMCGRPAIATSAARVTSSAATHHTLKSQVSSKTMFLFLAQRKASHRHLFLLLHFHKSVWWTAQMFRAESFSHVFHITTFGALSNRSRILGGSGHLDLGIHLLLLKCSDFSDRREGRLRPNLRQIVLTVRQ